MLGSVAPLAMFSDMLVEGVTTITILLLTLPNLLVLYKLATRPIIQVSHIFYHCHDI